MVLACLRGTADPKKEISVLQCSREMRALVVPPAWQAARRSFSVLPGSTACRGSSRTTALRASRRRAARSPAVAKSTPSGSPWARTEKCAPGAAGCRVQGDRRLHLRCGCGSKLVRQSRASHAGDAPTPVERVNCAAYILIHFSHVFLSPRIEFSPCVNGAEKGIAAQSKV